MLNVLLALIFFSRFGQILNAFLITSHQIKLLAVTHQIFTPLYFAAPACFYLYIYSFLHHKTRLRKLEWLHIIPLVLAIIHVIPWPFLSPLNWNIITSQLAKNGYFSLEIKTGLFPTYFHTILRPLLILSYLSLSWFTIFQFKPNRNTRQAGEKKWIIFFLKVCTFFQVLGLLRAILEGFQIPFYSSSFVIINCLALLGIFIYAVHKPYIFYGYLLVAVDFNKKLLDEDEGKILNLKNIKSIRKVKLDKSQLEHYAVQMEVMMRAEMPFILHDFQIIALATKLDIPVHHCSYIINIQIGRNFRDWINGYRVEYFLEHYQIKKDKITIEAMASEAGFKSSATFYNAFKKETGMMPTAYLEQKFALKNYKSAHITPTVE